MILQGSLIMEYNNEPYNLMVKTFLKNGVYYFYVSDVEKRKPLLEGEILELTFSDSFCTDESETKTGNVRIPAAIVSAVENMLLQNKQLWCY